RGIGKAEFGLPAAVVGLRVGSTVRVVTTRPAQHRLATLRLVGAGLAGIDAASLVLLLRTAKQEDRGDQQQAGGKDADAQQCGVGHSKGSPAKYVQARMA